jgi:hypothetical protein
MNDKISFADAIAFNRFTIKDQKNNALLINGAINTKKTLVIQDLISPDNFQALNKRERHLFYGEMYLDNHLTIRGIQSAC